MERCKNSDNRVEKSKEIEKKLREASQGRAKGREGNEFCRELTKLQRSRTREKEKTGDRKTEKTVQTNKRKPKKEEHRMHSTHSGT